jgi:small-conductance mechanosensitive channel
MNDFTGSASHWFWSLAVLVVAPIVGLIAHALTANVAGRLARLTSSTIDESIVRHARQPTRVLFPLLAELAALPAARLAPGALDGARHTVGIALIAVTAWLFVALLSVVDDLVAERYNVNVKNNLQARRVLTQIGVMRRVVIVVVAILTTGLILMTFPAIRHIGDSLLASAGLAGLVVGIAARPAIGNLIAGVQLALTEPIRLDDVVIVEGEWGRIEEIRTTYVVIRIWDLRRLVVPLSYFIEHPFQNWTRVSADLIGSVFVFADYRVPVEELRQEVHRILQTTDLWDGKVWNVQVTDATEHTVQIRALMSASDSSRAWDLRCLVREQLVRFLQERYPDSLPRARAEVGGLERAVAATATAG